MSEKPTLHSVAARAEVSIATVSRVINGRAAKPNTRERIEQAIFDLGYQPNSSARALKAKASEQICLILPDLANPVFQSMIRGLQAGFRTTKYRMMLSTSAMTSTEIVKQLHNLGQSYADGLIINALNYDDEITELLIRQNIPIVVLGTAPKGLLADSIRVDNEKGIELAVDYLYSRNLTRIAFVNGPRSTIPGKKRLKGFIQAISKYSNEDPESQVLQCRTFTAKAAIQALNDFNQIERFDAIICANDLLAAGTIKHLGDRKIRVPQDIAVIGIDNTDLAELLNPSITSIDFKAQYRGEMAAKFMRNRLANPDIPLQKLMIKPELIIRDSA